MDELVMVRIDRLASLCLGYPIAKLLGPRSGRVPILMYHSISDNLFGMSHPYYHINTSAEVFSRQMRWLRNNGYRTIDLCELTDRFERRERLEKTVIITFDDGYRDFMDGAMPVLKQCGFSATIFLATDRIQDAPMHFSGAEYLTWRDVRELHAEGIRFGSHTVSHPDMRSLGPEQIEYELGYSKEVIEQKLGEAVGSFAYPFAFPEEDRDFTRFLLDALENHGFQCGVTTVLGRASHKCNPYFLPRLPVNSWDDDALLQAKVAGGYDWMHWPQRIHKMLHHNAILMQRASWIESRGAK
jgi:peptidoglycan/xylan/chitin deacetylase (PgdA/CDA1 family)